MVLCVVVCNTIPREYKRMNRPFKLNEFLFVLFRFSFTLSKFSADVVCAYVSWRSVFDGVFFPHSSPSFSFDKMKINEMPMTTRRHTAKKNMRWKHTLQLCASLLPTLHFSRWSGLIIAVYFNYFSLALPPFPSLCLALYLSLALWIFIYFLFKSEQSKHLNQQYINKTVLCLTYQRFDWVILDFFAL